MLVDPHDQNAIAEALLKLVAEKNLWLDCRRNGWRNIHLFSWPEHCRTYLTRVAACRMRHPQWQTDTPLDDMPAEESLGDSLLDVQDISLRLSVDDRSSLNVSSESNPAELEKVAAGNGNPQVQDQVKQILNKMKKPAQDAQEPESEKKQPENAVSKYPMLRRRRRLFVIAVDCYIDQGKPSKKMLQVRSKNLNVTALSLLRVLLSCSSLNSYGEWVFITLNYNIIDISNFIITL